MPVFYLRNLTDKLKGESCLIHVAPLSATERPELFSQSVGSQGSLARGTPFGPRPLCFVSNHLSAGYQCLIFLLLPTCFTQWNWFHSGKTPFCGAVKKNGRCLANRNRRIRPAKQRATCQPSSTAGSALCTESQSAKVGLAKLCTDSHALGKTEDS